ncbi:MAG: cytochrome c [Methylocystis sp.]|nr:cytochrome c [Methylocystis sp.]
MRIALSLALVLIAAPAMAASADPATGAHIAKTDCASCHAIKRDAEAKSPDPKAPRFVDVAKMPSTTELSLKVFLRSPHRNMPNVVLAPEEIDSLASYILGLGGK